MARMARWGPILHVLLLHAITEASCVRWGVLLQQTLNTSGIPCDVAAHTAGSLAWQPEQSTQSTRVHWQNQPAAATVSPLGTLWASPAVAASLLWSMVTPAYTAVGNTSASTAQLTSDTVKAALYNLTDFATAWQLRLQPSLGGVVTSTSSDIRNATFDADSVIFLVSSDVGGVPPPIVSKLTTLRTASMANVTIASSFMGTQTLTAFARRLVVDVVVQPSAGVTQCRCNNSSQVSCVCAAVPFGTRVVTVAVPPAPRVARVDAASVDASIVGHASLTISDNRPPSAACAYTCSPIVSFVTVSSTGAPQRLVEVSFVQSALDACTPLQPQFTLQISGTCGWMYTGSVLQTHTAGSASATDRGAFTFSAADVSLLPFQFLQPCTITSSAAVINATTANGTTGAPACRQSLQLPVRTGAATLDVWSLLVQAAHEDAVLIIVTGCCLGLFVGIAAFVSLNDSHSRTCLQRLRRQFACAKQRAVTMISTRAVPPSKPESGHGVQPTLARLAEWLTFVSALSLLPARNHVALNQVLMLLVRACGLIPIQPLDFSMDGAAQSYTSPIISALVTSSIGSPATPELLLLWTLPAQLPPSGPFVGSDVRTIQRHLLLTYMLRLSPQATQRVALHMRDVLQSNAALVLSAGVGCACTLIATLILLKVSTTATMLTPSSWLRAWLLPCIRAVGIIVLPWLMIALPVTAASLAPNASCMPLRAAGAVVAVVILCLAVALRLGAWRRALVAAPPWMKPVSLALDTFLVRSLTHTAMCACMALCNCSTSAWSSAVWSTAIVAALAMLVHCDHMTCTSIGSLQSVLQAYGYILACVALLLSIAVPPALSAGFRATWSSTSGDADTAMIYMLRIAAVVSITIITAVFVSLLCELAAAVRCDCRRIVTSTAITTHYGSTMHTRRRNAHPVADLPLLVVPPTRARIAASRAAASLPARAYAFPPSYAISHEQEPPSPRDAGRAGRGGFPALLDTPGTPRTPPHVAVHINPVILQLTEASPRIPSARGHASVVNDVEAALAAAVAHETVCAEADLVDVKAPPAPVTTNASHDLRSNDVMLRSARGPLRGARDNQQRQMEQPVIHMTIVHRERIHALAQDNAAALTLPVPRTPQMPLRNRHWLLGGAAADSWLHQQHTLEPPHTTGPPLQVLRHAARNPLTHAAPAPATSTASAYHRARPDRVVHTHDVRTHDSKASSMYLRIVPFEVSQHYAYRRNLEPELIACDGDNKAIAAAQRARDGGRAIPSNAARIRAATRSLHVTQPGGGRRRASGRR